MTVRMGMLVSIPPLNTDGRFRDGMTVFVLAIISA